MAQTKTNQILSAALSAIDALRADGAHLHSITNTVAQNFTANVLLACGASVSMTVNPEEIVDFIGSADALHVNLGTLDNSRKAAIREAVKMASSKQLPVTLDPVKIELSPQRLNFAREIMPHTTVIRGNAQEIGHLQGIIKSGIWLVRTGKSDSVSDGESTFSISNGHRAMDRVIATGCALGALIAILCSKVENLEVACVAGLLWFGVSGELAAAKMKGPGSFQVEFLDALHTVSLDEIRTRAKIS